MYKRQAFIADIHAIARNNAAHLILRLVAEGAARHARLPGFVPISWHFAPQIFFSCAPSRALSGSKGWISLSLFTRLIDFIDDAVGKSLLRRHEVIALHIALDTLKRLPGHLAHQPVHLGLCAQQPLGMQLHIRRLAARAAARLMDHHLAVGQRQAHARLTRHQQKGSHRRGHAQAHLSLIHISLSLTVSLPSGRQSEFLLSTRLFGVTQSENDFSCPHVGIFPVGVRQIGFSDCFGLFSLRHRVRAPLPDLAVLPRPARTAPVSFSPGEGESTSTQRAQADRSTPADIRAWQEGDELKRVHWKLSMRRQSLMVHTYETPQRPDALVLLNCALPSCPPALRPVLLDALTETCAGVLKSLLDAGHMVRLPLSGQTQRELSGKSSDALPLMLHALAQESFDGAPDFARVLWESARRMHRTGAAILLSCELTPPIADAAIALSRMGAHTRFTLVTSGEVTKTQRQLLSLLLSSGLEATHCLLYTSRCV